MSRWGRQDDPMNRQIVSPARKSKGLYKEDWEWAQAATKSCGRNVQLPAVDDHPVLLNTDKGRLCQIRASPDAKQVERHHFFLACRSLRDNHILFRIFDFSILNPRTSYLPTSTHSFNIQTMSSLDKTHLRHRSVDSQSISYIVVATSLSPGFGPSEKGSLAGA